MSGGTLLRRSVKQVRPILSLDKEEARKRVLNLYKAWYRQLPYVGNDSSEKLVDSYYVILFCFYNENEYIY